MDNFTTIYKILSYLEKAMDYDQPDWRAIGAEHLGINENRWRHIMKMLIDNGYIEGVAVLPIMGSGFDFKFINPAITLAGLSYLEENSTMKKAYKILKGIKDITPGI